MNILITGHSGFIGSYLTKYLKGHKIILSNFRLNDIQAMENQISAQTIDCLIHLAAWSNVQKCDANPKEAKQINTEASNNLINCLTKYHPRAQFIFMSTAHVYGIKEGVLSETDVLNPISFYGQTKLDAENILLKSSCPNLTILRLFNTSHKNCPSPNFLKNIYDQLMTGAAELEMGDITVQRDFMAIFEVLEALALVIENPKGKRIYNLSSNVSKSLGDCVIEMAKQLNITPPKFKINKKFIRDNEPKIITGDSSLIQKELSWSPNSISVSTLITEFLKDFS